MLVEILLLVILCFLPIFELRLAVPFGIIVLGMNSFLVFLICLLANFVVGLIVYWILDLLILVACKFKFLKTFYDKKVLKVQKKIHPQVEKYGWIALALFIGVPLPGSGVYTGALAAKLMGMDFKEFVFSCLLGVFISGLIMTGISVFFTETLNMMNIHLDKVEVIQRLIQ